MKRVGCALLVLLALAFFLGLLLAAQTVGVEAWHDSAVPQSAFTAIRTPLVPEVAQRQSATPPEAAAGSRGAVEVAGSNPVFGASGVHQPSTLPPTRAAALSPAAETSTARRAVDAIPSLAPASRPALGVAASVTGELTGTASWFSSPADVSAAGPALRAAIGPGWRGTVVRVCAGMRCVRTVLGDWCGCVVGGSERVVDLDWRSFAALAPLSAGLVKVEVTW